MQTPEYKIMLLGDTCLGKTTFCKKLINRGNNYLNLPPTLGVDVDLCDYYVNHRKLRLSLWDTSGDERYKGLGSGYYVNTNGAIIFKDKNNKYIQYKNSILNKCGNIPIVYIEYDMDKDISEYMVKINELVNLL